MKKLIKGEKVEVTDSIKEYIQDKFSKLNKYFENPSEIEAKVIVKVKGVEQKIEITIQTKGYFLRAEESHSDLYAAIDLVSDKIERQCIKYKNKLKSKNRQNTVEFNDYIDIEEENEEIVKRKKIYLKPMDEEEAIMQMELLGHMFYVFKNIETDSVCVVYKRHTGDYGIIETN